MMKNRILCQWETWGALETIAYSVQAPDGIQMELCLLQPHFGPMSCRRLTSPDATGTLSPVGIALTQSVREC